MCSAVLINLMFCCIVFAQTSSAEVMQTMRKLATDRLALDRCVEHPDYNKEAMNASPLFLETQQVSSRLDRLVNDLHFTAPNRMPYMGYVNVLRQLRALESTNPQAKQQRARESIALACDPGRIAGVRAELKVLEKQIKPLLQSNR